jgi:hypothetical protein
LSADETTESARQLRTCVHKMIVVPSTLEGRFAGDRLYPGKDRHSPAMCVRRIPKKFCWLDHLGGYFVSAVGWVEEMIRIYTRNQERLASVGAVEPLALTGHFQWPPDLGSR